MKKFSFKWKIFLVISYLELFCWGLMMIVSIINLITTKPTGAGIIFIPALVFSLLIICVNVSLGIFAAHQFFPDKLLPRRIKISLRVTAILKAIIWFGFLVLFIIEIKSFSSVTYQTSKAEILALIILCALWLFGIYTLILQLDMIPQLNRNHGLKMKQLIDTIGDA